MKRRSNLSVTVVIAVLAMLASCSGGEEHALSPLETKRDSIKTAIEELGKELSEIEKQITLLDTAIKPPLVTTRVIVRQDFISYFTVQGSVNTDRNAQVLPELPGLIKKIFVREGDRVNEGQKMVQLDDAIIRTQLQQLEVNLALSSELFEKQKKLWQQKIGSELQYLQAKNNKENIEESMRQTKEMQAKYTILAPFSGTVDQVNLKEGELASQMTPILRLVDLSNMYIKADVSENYISKTRTGADVQVIIPNMDTVQSTIARVGDFIKPENRTFEITVNLPKKNPLFKPNLVGNVRISDYRSDSTIVLPTSLIMRDAESRDFVFVVNRSGAEPTAKKVILQTGKNHDGLSEVISGLDGSEILVDKGARKLIDGQVIRFESGPEAKTNITQ